MSLWAWTLDSPHRRCSRYQTEASSHLMFLMVTPRSDIFRINVIIFSGASDSLSNMLLHINPVASSAIPSHLVAPPKDIWSTTTGTVNEDPFPWLFLLVFCGL